MITQALPKTFLKNQIIVKLGDITGEHVDAIVNAANGTLMGGGGVDGAIHRKGGKSILEECRKIRETQYPEGLPAGKAVTTKAGALPAHYIIHTVGPVWHGGESREDELLESCYVCSLEEAVKHACQTVAFPAISTGVYRFPKERAARVSSKAIEGFLRSNTSVKQVTLVFFSEEDALIFLKHQQFSE